MSAVQSGPISQKPERALEDLVQRFSAALLAKLQASERKYGWQNAWLRADWTNECRHELRRHIEKGIHSTSPRSAHFSGTTSNRRYHPWPVRHLWLVENL